MYLRFYVWLRDAAAKKFTDSNLQKYLWQQMNQISRLPPSNTSEGINDDEQPPRVNQRRTCKICGSSTIHAKIWPLSLWSTCPFSSASDKRLAYKSRGLVNVHMQENNLDHTNMEVVRQKLRKQESLNGTQNYDLKVFWVSTFAVCATSDSKISEHCFKYQKIRAPNSNSNVLHPFPKISSST